MLRNMSNLNYHHLEYFWEVARHRSVSRAARELGVSQPTVSAQIKSLEQALGTELFIRTGRDLVLTNLGQMVYEYACEIFTLGRELQQAVLTRQSNRSLQLRVGITDSMPKRVAHVLIRPAMGIGQPFQLFVKEDRHDRILSELASHQLDIVLGHEPAPSASAFKGKSFHLGESGVSFFAASDLARRIKGSFPQNLDQVPIYLPTPETTLRRLLEDWFAQENVRPRLVGEFSDNAMMETFGQGGAAVFPTLTLVENEVVRQFRVRVIGRTEQVRERFFAITSSRRLTHPGVQAICRQPRLLADLVDGMPISDIGVLKKIVKRLRERQKRSRSHESDFSRS